MVSTASLKGVMVMEVIRSGVYRHLYIVTSLGSQADGGGVDTRYVLRVCGGRRIAFSWAEHNPVEAGSEGSRSR